jgi:hypothetical protein
MVGLHDLQRVSLGKCSTIFCSSEPSYFLSAVCIHRPISILIEECRLVTLKLFDLGAINR